MEMPKLTDKEWARVDDLVENHDMTMEEAISIIQEDKVIDKGGKTAFDLSDEEHKKAMKNANADTHRNKGEKVKRERKPNETKGGLIAEIATFLKENCGMAVENVEISNKEREITFKVGETEFSLTLIQHRAPKK